MNSQKDELMRLIGRLENACDVGDAKGVDEFRSRISSALDSILKQDTASIANEAYAFGWAECATWASRADLIDDIGSLAYLKDRAPNIETAMAGIKFSDVNKVVPLSKFPSSFIDMIREGVESGRLQIK